MVKLNKNLIKDYMNNTNSNATDETYSCDYINKVAIWEDINTSSWSKGSGFSIIVAKYNKLTHEVWIEAENCSSSGAMNGVVMISGIPNTYRPSSTISIKNAGTIWWGTTVGTSTPMAKTDATIDTSGSITLFYPIHTTAYNHAMNIRYIAN